MLPRQFWKIALVLTVVGLGLTGPGPAAAQAAGPAAAKAPPPAATGKPQGENVPRKGQWIRVPLPLDNSAVVRIKQTIQRTLGTVEGARPVFVLEFSVPGGAAEAGRGTQFEDAHKLAKFLVGDDLNSATTVAYIPKALKGHAVLVALACDQVIMAPLATMGEAGADEKDIDNTMVAAYQEISRSRHTVPVEVALGMLDRSRQVLRATTEVSTEYVTPAGLAELRRGHPIVSQEQIKPAGESWQFSGSEGRKWGFVGFLAEERRDVIRAMELTAEVAETDPASVNGWHAIRIDLKGTVTAEKVSQVVRLIDEQTRSGVNFICLWIESPGGSPVESMELASRLAKLDRNAIRTVAYVPTEARADAALVAMACDQLVVHPHAVLGGPGAYQMSEDEIVRYRQTIRDSLASDKMRSWSLWAAMIDPSLAVFRCTRPGDVDYFSDEEQQARQPKLDRGEKGPPWAKGELVTTPGRVLQLTGDRAVEYRLARTAVESFTQFKQQFGLENDPTLIEAGWADRLVQFLRSTEIAVLLIVVGGLALYFELHAPGVGIGGFISLVCFALFFWSRYSEGSPGWLVVTLFATGIVCLLLEFFVLPGFAIFGVGGGLLILASLILASQTFIIPRNEYQLAQMQRSVMTIATAMGLILVAAILMRRWLPRAPVLSHVFLTPPEAEEAETIRRREMLVDLENLVGTTGTSTSPLTPGGKARFQNHLIDVITRGEFVPRNSPIVVIEVHGNRVVVQAVGGG